MQEIQHYDELTEKTLEVILNFKPTGKIDKGIEDELLKLKNEVKKIINSLSYEIQDVLKLRYFHNLSHNDIAQKLGKPEEEITQIILKAVNEIKNNIGEDIVEVSKDQILSNQPDIKSTEYKKDNLEKYSFDENKVALLSKLSGLVFIILLLFAGYFLLKQAPFTDFIRGNLFSDTKNKPQGNPYSIKISGSTSLLALSGKWQESFIKEYPKYKIALGSLDSDNGINELLDGRVDIANSSRPISFSDFRDAKNKGLELVENRIALDALIVIVNKKNNLDELSIDNLSEIYSGEIKFWNQQLGGSNIPILLGAREEGSGTNEFIMSRILFGDNFSRSVVHKNSNDAIIELVSENEGAISCLNSSNFPWGNENIKYIKIRSQEDLIGVSPFEDKKLNVKAIRYGNYPLAHYLYIVTLADAPKKVLDYIDWVLGENGQNIVKESGLIPVNIEN